MTNFPFIPLEGGFGPHGPPWAGGPPPFASFLGAVMCLLFFLLLAGTFFLVRRGQLGGPPWAGRPGTPWAHRNAPEADAKRILAERFANGDISSDEFMERASVLNWTPGSDSQDPGRGGGWKPKKRR